MSSDSSDGNSVNRLHAALRVVSQQSSRNTRQWERIALSTNRVAWIDVSPLGNVSVPACSATVRRVASLVLPLSLLVPSLMSPACRFSPDRTRGPASLNSKITIAEKSADFRDYINGRHTFSSAFVTINDHRTLRLISSPGITRTEM